MILELKDGIYIWFNLLILVVIDSVYRCSKVYELSWWDGMEIFYFVLIYIFWCFKLVKILFVKNNFFNKRKREEEKEK